MLTAKCCKGGTSPGCGQEEDLSGSGEPPLQDPLRLARDTLVAVFVQIPPSHPPLFTLALTLLAFPSKATLVAASAPTTSTHLHS